MIFLLLHNFLHTLLCKWLLFSNGKGLHTSKKDPHIPIYKNIRFFGARVRYLLTNRVAVRHYFHYMLIGNIYNSPWLDEAKYTQRDNYNLSNNGDRHIMVKSITFRCGKDVRHKAHAYTEGKNHQSCQS